LLLEHKVRKVDVLALVEGFFVILFVVWEIQRQEGAMAPVVLCLALHSCHCLDAGASTVAAQMANLVAVVTATLISSAAASAVATAPRRTLAALMSIKIWASILEIARRTAETSACFGLPISPTFIWWSASCWLATLWCAAVAAPISPSLWALLAIEARPAI
jgi:hypothetical protein